MTRDNPNRHIARATAEPAPAFQSGFQREGRPAFLILPPLPHIAAPYDRADIAAWKSLNMGTAAQHQQTRAFEHLALLTNFNGDPYVPGDPVASAYGMGKRRVFQQIMDIVRFVEASRQEGGEAPKENG